MPASALLLVSVIHSLLFLISRNARAFGRSRLQRCSRVWLVFARMRTRTITSHEFGVEHGGPQAMKLILSTKDEQTSSSAKRGEEQCSKEASEATAARSREAVREHR